MATGPNDLIDYDELEALVWDYAELLADIARDGV